MLNLNFVTPKKHFLARNHDIWAIVRSNQLKRFPVEDGKKKRERKEREGKAQKVMQALYFTYLWGNLLQMDFYQILHIRRYARPNHLCKFWVWKN